MKTVGAVVFTSQIITFMSTIVVTMALLVYLGLTIIVINGSVAPIYVPVVVVPGIIGLISLGVYAATFSHARSIDCTTMAEL